MQVTCSHCSGVGRYDVPVVLDESNNEACEWAHKAKPLVLNSYIAWFEIPLVSRLHDVSLDLLSELECLSSERNKVANKFSCFLSAAQFWMFRKPFCDWKVFKMYSIYGDFCRQKSVDVVTKHICCHKA